MPHCFTISLARKDGEICFLTLFLEMSLDLFRKVQLFLILSQSTHFFTLKKVFIASSTIQILISQHILKLSIVNCTEFSVLLKHISGGWTYINTYLFHSIIWNCLWDIYDYIRLINKVTFLTFRDILPYEWSTRKLKLKLFFKCLFLRKINKIYTNID